MCVWMHMCIDIHIYACVYVCVYPIVIHLYLFHFPADSFLCSKIYVFVVLFLLTKTAHESKSKYRRPTYYNDLAQKEST